MTAELIKRLRGAPDRAYLVGTAGDIKHRHLQEAADRIEALEADNAALLAEGGQLKRQLQIKADRCQAAEADAERFQYCLSDPVGVRHLLRLLADGKGDEVAFCKLLDRVIVSGKADPKYIEQQRKSRERNLRQYEAEHRKDAAIDKGPL